jgi:1-acyl-sn-glycerol-3-phosphate acyltransferase
MTRGLGSFSVRRGQSDRDAIRTALELLAHGACVGVFPEGTRSRSGTLAEGKTGAGLLALRSGATIVPVALVGTGRLTGVSALVRRHRIDIIIGEPFRLELPNGPGRAATVATEVMMRKIADLLPPEMRGYYADRPMTEVRGGGRS